MRRAHKVRLSREQEDDLQRYARSRTLAARLVERSKMLLLCATGHSAEEIAEQLDMTRQTVCRWLSRFEAQGMKGVEHDAPRSGRPPLILPAKNRRDRREDDAPDARGRHPLEHAHVGPGGRRQRVHSGTDLAGARFETASGE